ncbi:MAG: Acyl-phosphate:glycerol-3-phosphate O-acyltransferase PlsY (EC [uncultured Thermomicrobiales bacterium]|uniref:Glycerol-3-phosphate acyltransferase n=1 Tax=uncultured Thermomicrobiales bacterium TaxID=1645740 RepID=A0A6J4UWU7_9BACT|nr:MAG: Acyl-phosphate:glycerol-3-phosphate O-acyltransferase PlsY (EC [uncultured Thermomicrobiales bacterium]
MVYLLTLGMLVVAYFCGSVPSGFLIIRATTGKDIRQFGSGNIGMANAYRVGGAVPALLVLLGDALKGAIPVLIAGRALGLPDLAVVLVGLAAILGHDFPIFLRGHGGKGIATSLGVITALVPPVGIVAVIVWWIVILSTGYASLASLIMLFVATIVLAFYDSFFLTQHHPIFLVFFLALFVVAVWQHRANIERLRQGKELKLRGEREGAKPGDAT